MGPFIQMPAAPNKWEALAGAFSQGLQKGTDVFLQNKLQTMLADQQTKRNAQKNLQLFGNAYGGADPKEAAIAHKLDLEYKDRSAVQSAIDEMYGLGKEGEDKIAPPSRVSQSLQGLGEEPRELPPGKDMMLPYEDMPAENPIVQPRANEVAKKAIPEQRMSPSEKYESEKAKLDQQFQQSMQSYRGPHPEKITAAYNARLQALERQRTNEEAAESRKSKEKLSKITREEKATQKFVEDVSKKRETLNSRRSALDIQRDAIQRGNFGPLSLSHIANILGLPESAGTDANQLMAGVKTSLFDRLSSITGVKNVFLEQMTLSALPQVGSTKSGNLIKTDVADLELKLDEALINAYDEISDKYENDPEFGYFPKKAEKEIYKKIKPIAQDLQREYYNKFQQDREIEQSDQDLAFPTRNPSPTIVTQRRSDAIVARAEKDLEKATGKKPTMRQVLDYATQILKDNNFIVGKE